MRKNHLNICWNSILLIAEKNVVFAGCGPAPKSFHSSNNFHPPNDSLMDTGCKRVHFQHASTTDGSEIPDYESFFEGHSCECEESLCNSHAAMLAAATSGNSGLNAGYILVMFHVAAMFLLRWHWLDDGGYLAWGNRTVIKIKTLKINKKKVLSMYNLFQTRNRVLKG